MKNYPSVSIIFPNYNGGSEPLDCLASIYQLNYPKSLLNITIIDNGSTDGSDLKIKHKYPQINFIKLRKNLGFAKAINLGIKKNLSKYVFIGNDDIVFDKNSLKVLVNYLEKHPKTGVVGGKIVTKYAPNRKTPSGYFMNKWTGDIYPLKNLDRIADAEWIQGCGLLTTQNLINRIGLLDEGYSHFFEDFDFCLKAKKANYKIIYLPRAVFFHGESTTANKDLKRKYYEWYKNKFRFMLKNLSILNILSILLTQIFIIMPIRGLILQDGRFVPFIRGFYWNIINLPKTLSLRYSS